MNSERACIQENRAPTSTAYTRGEEHLVRVEKRQRRVRISPTVSTAERPRKNGLESGSWNSSKKAAFHGVMGFNLPSLLSQYSSSSLNLDLIAPPPPPSTAHPPLPSTSVSNEGPAPSPLLEVLCILQWQARNMILLDLQINHQGQYGLPEWNRSMKLVHSGYKDDHVLL